MATPEATLGLADELKTATAAAHKDAENRAFQKMLGAGNPPADAYAAYLGQLHHVHQYFERHYAAHPDAAEVIGWSDDFRHSDRITDDLAKGNAEVAAPSTTTTAFLAKLDDMIASNPAAIHGAFYVLEGSMNGNRFLARGLRSLPFGLSYLDPYGDEQRGKWMAVRERLNAHLFNHDERQAVLDAAAATFTAVGDLSDDAANA